MTATDRRCLVVRPVVLFYAAATGVGVAECSESWQTFLTGLRSQSDPNLMPNCKPLLLRWGGLLRAVRAGADRHAPSIAIAIALRAVCPWCVNDLTVSDNPVLLGQQWVLGIGGVRGQGVWGRHRWIKREVEGSNPVYETGRVRFF